MGCGAKALMHLPNFSQLDNPSDTVGAVFGALGDAGDPIEGSTYGGWGSFLMVVIGAFFFVDIFDTAGTLYGVGRMAGKVKRR